MVASPTFAEARFLGLTRFRVDQVGLFPAGAGKHTRLSLDQSTRETRELFIGLSLLRVRLLRFRKRSQNR